MTSKSPPRTAWSTVAGSLLVLAIGLPLARGDDTDTVDARQQLAGMEAADKQEFEDKRQRFYSLPADEQERLRSMHHDLGQAADGERLREVMQRYTTWLRSLPSGQRAELLSLPPESRLEQIKLLLQQQEEWRMRNYVMRELNAKDMAVIVKWVEDFVSTREREILERLPELKKRWGELDTNKRRQSLLFFAARLGPARGLLRPGEEDIERLKQQLSPSAQQELEKAQRQGRLAEVAESWMRAAMFSRRSGPEVPREELKRFYAELEAPQREYLENLPAERMEHELTRLYHYSRFRKFWESDRPPFSRPGDRLRGRGRGGWPGGPSGRPNGDRTPLNRPMNKVPPDGRKRGVPAEDRQPAE
jgi:hypothetical protein